MEDTALKIGKRLPAFTRPIVMENMVEFETVVWNRGRNLHSNAEAARQDGLTRPLASGQNQLAFLHELLERTFGDAWVYGGKISVRYIYPVYPGDSLTIHGVVTSLDNDEGGKPKVGLEVWCENQNGQKTAVGKVTAAQPVSARSWLESSGGAS